MFIIKTVYNEDNYNAVYASSYSVHRPPQERDPKDVPKDVKERLALAPKVSYSGPYQCHGEILVYGCEVYIENGNGKTVDVIRPRFESSLAA